MKRSNYTPTCINNPSHLRPPTSSATSAANGSEAKSASCKKKESSGISTPTVSHDIYNRLYSA